MRAMTRRWLLSNRRRALLAAHLLPALLLVLLPCAPGVGTSAAASMPAQPAPAPATATVVNVGVGSGAGAWTVDDALWDRPRSAEVIRTLAAVRSAVAALHATAGAMLVIRHGGGQNDGFRADELRHWLVALAVDPGRIVLAPPADASTSGLPRGTLVLEVAR